MANVLFTRTSEPSSKPITDGQLIFDTSGNGKMYLDVGDERLEMGGAKEIDSVLNATSTNPIQNKAVAGVMLDNLSDISNVTRKGFLPDALAIKELNSSLETLTTPNTVKVYVNGGEYIELLICGKIVICQGALSNKTGTITTFPEKYRPIEDMRFNVHGNDGTLYKNGEFFSSSTLNGFFNFTYLLA